ncbi:VPS10 domain-containing protein [Echinicola sediminis]
MRSLLFFLFLSTTFLQAQDQRAYLKRLKSERVASGQEITWQQFGPGNAGFANLLRYHPTIPGKVALCPDMWNAYQTDNNGDSWYGITDDDGDGTFYHLRDLYYAYSNPEMGLAISSSELWITKDTGRTWEVVKNCPWYETGEDGEDLNRWKKKVASLAIDPTDKNRWFVGGGSNVRGQEWLSCYKDLKASNPHGTRSPYEGKLWRTTDAGNSWETVTKGLHPKAQVGRIIVNPLNPQQVFASSNYGLYRSGNGGDSWTQIGEKQLDNGIIMDMDFYFNPKTNRFVLYLIDQVQYHPNAKTTSCTGGVFYSEDSGNSWHKINGNMVLDINQLSGGVPENYYQYVAEWFELTVKQAFQKYPELPSEALQRFNMISADPSRDGAVYVGFADPQTGNSIMPGRLWASSDFGKSWISTARLYEEAWARDSSYWLSRNQPITENMDVGHASPHMRWGDQYALRSMRALDVGVDGSVMIISDHSTMLSTDHGKNWQQVDETQTFDGGLVGHGNSNLPGLTIAQDRRTVSPLFGSGEHRLWIPTGEYINGVLAVEYIPSTQATVSNLAYDPYDPKIIYATSNRQEDKECIFRSTDGGYSWENYGIATPATKRWKDDFYTNGLTIDPLNNKFMYFGITQIVDRSKADQGGFFFSDNYGKTFSQRNKGLPVPARINDIQFDPRDESRRSLFIAAQKNDKDYFPPKSEGGLFHSSDRGANWFKVNLPPEVEGVQFIKFDLTNRMYISTGHYTGGQGLWFSDDFGMTWEQLFPLAGVECIDISPFDYNLIVLSLGFEAKNPGIYFSWDRGKSWHKNNEGITIPHRIEDVKFDLKDPSKLWLATLGCGFYEGKIHSPVSIQKLRISPTVVAGKVGGQLTMEVDKLDASLKGKKLDFISENPGVVTVDQTGKLTFQGIGLTKVWVRAEGEGGSTDYAVVTVR